MSQTEYKNILTEIIKKQISRVGPALALERARRVKGLTVGDDGLVIEASGPEQGGLQRLIEEYAALQGWLIKSDVNEIFDRYHVAQS